MCLSRISFVHSFYIINIYGFYITRYLTSFNILSSCVPTVELSSYQRLCAKMQIALNRTGRFAGSLLRELPAKNKTIYIYKIYWLANAYYYAKMQKTKRYRYKYLVYNSTWLGSLSWSALGSFCVATNLLHINLNLRDLNKLHYFAHRHTRYMYIVWFI